MTRKQVLPLTVLAATALGVLVLMTPSANREPDSPNAAFLAGADSAGSTHRNGSNQFRQDVLSTTYRSLPLGFEANRGQAAPEVLFLSRGAGYDLLLMPTAMVLTLGKKNGTPTALGDRAGTRAQPAETAGPAVVRMKLVGANEAPDVAGLDEMPGRVNYFLGRDPTGWRPNIPTYKKIQYRNVYPAVDLVYHGSGRRLEYDFIVGAGADPSVITLDFEGAEEIEIDARGDLVIHTAGGRVRHSMPVAYQETNGGRVDIAAGYVLRPGRHVGFWLGSRDVTKPVIIDPVLVYATYLGGTGDDLACGVTVDVSGNAYVSGWTSSTDFPVTAGSFPGNGRGGSAFVIKLSRDGDEVIYATFLGGDDKEFEVCGIAVDASGNAYVSGITASTNFPTTYGAFQAAFGNMTEVFVTKLDATGSTIVYSTFLGGSRDDASQGLALDAEGNVFVAGNTTSPDFPTTPGAVQTVFGGEMDVFVTKLNATGSGLEYSTYLGGRHGEFVAGLAVDAAGLAHVTGVTGSTDFPTTAGVFQSVHAGSSDAFVTKLNATGSALHCSTYLGGGGDDAGRGIAVDASGFAHVTGSTRSWDFPTTLGAFQTVLAGDMNVFVMKLDSACSTLAYSSYLAIRGSDRSKAIALDASGNAYVTGGTTFADPTVPAFDGFTESAFALKMDPDGASVLYLVFFGGAASDRARAIAVDSSGNAYVAGFTNSPNFPLVNPAQAMFAGGSGDCVFFSGGGPSCDAFVVKIAAAPTP